MCSFYNVSRSGYYSWLRRPETSPKDTRLLKMIEECQAKHKRRYGYRRVTAWLKSEKGYTSKSLKLPSKLRSLPRSSFFITTLKEFKAVRDLLHTKNGANGMTQIGKAAEWVYRFCFREAVSSKKETMPSPAIYKFMRFLGLLLDVVPRKGIIMSIIDCYYS